VRSAGVDQMAGSMGGWPFAGWGIVSGFLRYMVIQKDWHVAECGKRLGDPTALSIFPRVVSLTPINTSGWLFLMLLVAADTHSSNRIGRSRGSVPLLVMIGGSGRSKRAVRVTGARLSILYTSDWYTSRQASCAREATGLSVSSLANTRSMHVGYCAAVFDSLMFDVARVARMPPPPVVVVAPLVVTLLAAGVESLSPSRDPAAVVELVVDTTDCFWTIASEEEASEGAGDDLPPAYVVPLSNLLNMDIGSRAPLRFFFGVWMKVRENPSSTTFSSALNRACDSSTRKYLPWAALILT